MTISMFTRYKIYKESTGWTPSWSAYCMWLKERKQKQEKRRIKEELLEERRKHNDKVCRMYGIGKYARKDNDYV